MTNLRPPAGFTLVELLVVIAIMGLVLAIVGPFSQQQITRNNRVQEIAELEQRLSFIQRTAYLNGHTTELVLNGKALTVHAGEETSHYEFENIFFPVQNVSVNPHGFASQPVVEVFAGERRLEIRLRQSLGPTK